MSRPEAANAAPQPHDPPGAAETNIQNLATFPSSRTLNSSSRLSFHTDPPTTRRSSYQSAQASLYQDAESLAFESANDDDAQPDLDSDLEVRSQRVPSRADRSRTASPIEAARPGSAARVHPGNVHESALETTLDHPASSSSNTTAGALGRRRSYQRQSAELSRPLSSLSRRSSASATAHDDPHNRLRDAAMAAANRSSMSIRRHSVEIDQLANSISRASTPHGFRTEDDDDDSAAKPRSRPSSSIALRRYEQDGGSFIKRDGKDRASILPPAAFFAPKKPSARNSSSNLLGSTASSTSLQATRSTTPLFYSGAPNQVDARKAQPQAQEEIRDYRGTSPTPYEQQAAGTFRSRSPWRIAASASADPSATDLSNSRLTQGAAPPTPLEPSEGFPTPSAQPSPQSVVRMMTSADPLLPTRVVRNAGTGTHGAGLGLETSTAPKKETTGRSGAGAPSATQATGTADKVEFATANVTAAPAATKHRPKRGPRNYKHHQGENRFLLRGLLMTSGDNPLPFILSYLLLLVLGGLFFGFEAAWLSDNISPAVVAFFAYIWLLAVVNMGVTAFKDPGVVPRSLDPDPPCVLGETPFSPGHQALADPEDPLAVPVQRVLRIRNQTVKVKWCETCGTYRPPRSSHCRVCDNCVENIDHHCTYLNTCIGRRNYVQFMVFLLTSILSALYVIAFTVLRLVLLTKPTTYRYPRGKGSVTAPGYNFRQALANSPVSAVLFLLCIAVLAPLLVLFVYHVRLVLLNRSTVEQIRINTAREYGEHKELELGTHGEDDDAASTFGAAEANRRGRRGKGGTGAVRALFERFGVLKPKYKDPNPFATRSTRTNVRNALGWRSIQLESWIDRRGIYSEETRRPHPRIGYKAKDGDSATGLAWKV